MYTDRTRLFAVLSAVVSLFASQARAQLDPAGAVAGSLEDELSWLRAEAFVFSASRREERVFDTASAVYVVTDEDIRRMGATSVPEALHTVPGLQVFQFSNSTWSVNVRGFYDRTISRLLVLVDGRTLYSPVMAGVWWDAQNIPLANVKRIEVIRGPGATMWGANAVFGIINIITKDASETQGGLLTAGAGTLERGFGTFRYGGTLSEDTAYRVHLDFFRRDGMEWEDGGDVGDDWYIGQGGFRLDWTPPDRIDRFTLQGDMYSGASEDPIENFYSLDPPYVLPGRARWSLSGGNILGRWERKLAEENVLTLQAYFDRAKRSAINLASAPEEPRLTEAVNTYDLDLQHDLRLSARHKLMWGLGYRYVDYIMESDVTFAQYVAFDPMEGEQHLFSAFVQDEITLLPDELRLILGSKFEHNDYTGFEVQPSGRLIWSPDDDNTVWAAVSRALHSASPGSRHFAITQAVVPPGVPPNPHPLIPMSIIAQGNPDYDSDATITYELGYRNQSVDRLLLDGAVFYSRHKEVREYVQGAPVVVADPTPHLELPVVATDGAAGWSYGAELTADWAVDENWDVKLSYAYVESRTDLPDSDDRVVQNLCSAWVFGRPLDDWEIGLGCQFVDKREFSDLDSYIRTDAQLTWTPTDDLELSVVGQNLFNRGTVEAQSRFLPAELIEIPRSVYGRITYRF